MTQNTFTLPDSFAIPTMPAIANRISTMMRDPNVGLADIAKVLAQDAPLAAKVLKIANSSFYGLRERCMSTQQASSILGLNVLKNVVLQAAVIKQFEHLKGAGADLNHIWRHSIVTAQTCSFLVRHATKKVLLTAEDAYTCGLLHDLGEVVLIDNLRELYVKLWTRARTENVPLFVMEQHALGFTHSEVGARVATRWSLPPPVVHAIGLHHAPDSEIDRDPIVALISLANLLVERISDGNASGATSLFSGEVGNLLGIQPDAEAAAIDFVTNSLQTVEI